MAISEETTFGVFFVQKILCEAACNKALSVVSDAGLSIS